MGWSEGTRQFNEFRFTEMLQFAPNTVRVPFELAGRLIIVKAEVDGIGGDFILDTGADKLVLNKSYYEGIAAEGKYKVAGINGVIGEVQRRKVEQLNWDNLSWEQIFADVIDLSHIEGKKNQKLYGLIGYEVLKDFEVLIDFQSKLITLTRLGRDGHRIDKEAFDEVPEDTLQFDLIGHIIVLDAKVADKSVQFSLDTGAELNLLDFKAYKGLVDYFKILKRVNLSGTGKESLEVLAGKLYKVKLGAIYCSGMRTLITNLDDINKSFRVKINGVLGYEFLFNRRTLINYKHKKLYFLKWARP